MAKIAGIYGIMGAADCVSQCNRKLAQKVENEMEAVRAHPQRRQEEVVQRLLQGRRQGDQAADRVSCRRAPQLALSPAPIWHDSGRRRCAAAGGHTPRAPRARTQGSRYTSRRPSSRPRARVHGTEMRSDAVYCRCGCFRRTAPRGAGETYVFTFVTFQGFLAPACMRARPRAQSTDFSGDFFRSLLSLEVQGKH